MANFTLRVNDKLFLKYEEYCNKRNVTKSDDLRIYIYNTVSRYENTLKSSLKNIYEITEDFCNVLDKKLLDKNKDLLFELSKYLLYPDYKLIEEFYNTIDNMIKLNNIEDKTIDFDLYYSENLKDKMTYKDFITQFLLATERRLNKN